EVHADGEVLAPVPLVLAGLGVIHDHAPVPVTIADIHLVGRLVDAAVGRLPQIRGVVAAVMDAMLPDLEQELPRRRELQHLGVLVAIAPDPEVPFVVDPEPVIRVGPLISLPWPAPIANQVSSLIEPEYRRGDGAACSTRRFELVINSAGAMDHPHMVLAINRNADSVAQGPII